MTLARTGSRLPGISHHLGWPEDAGGEGHHGPKLGGHPLCLGPPVIPRIRKFLPPVYRELFQGSGPYNQADR